MKKFGVDLSKWQKGISLKKLRQEGAEFVILRGAYHTGKDTSFETFYAEARQEGLPTGVYLYTMATTPAEVRKEADALERNVLRGKQFELPVFFDIEDKVQKALSREQNTVLVEEFCRAMREKGYLPGVYASKSFFDTYLYDERLAGVEHWVAQWTETCTYRGDYGIWQFGGGTNKLRSPRLAGRNVDQNYMLRDYPTLVRNSGLNNYGKAENPTTGIVRFVIDPTGLNVRKSGSVSSPILRVLEYGEEVQVLQEEGKWSRIADGWVYSSLLGQTKPEARSAQTTANLRLRAGAGTTKEILLTIPKGGLVTIRIAAAAEADGYSWAKVTYNGTTGFAAEKYLR